MFKNSNMYEEEIKKEEEAYGDEGNPKCWFDIKIGDKEPRRVTFELYKHTAPKTAQNFLCLCTGEKGNGVMGKPLHYLNSLFHRVVPGYMMMGGDITQNNGRGGDSIYGYRFKDESFKFNHTKAGLLSMVNAGPNTNNSQFFITFGPIPELDGHNVVFG